MIHLVADENIVGLDRLRSDSLRITSVEGRALRPRHLRDADALWVRSVTRVDDALLDGSSLRFVGTATAGLEHIDRGALKARGIRFAAAPGANANSVVEYVLAALLELQAPWNRLENGGSLGVVGYGAVGRGLCAVALALGWQVHVCDPWVEKDPAFVDSPERGTAPFCSLEKVLGCDVISLHCSLHRRAPWPSHHLIDARALAGLEERQWLINAARGPVIDNRALLTRLGEGAAPACVLDVWEGEPEFDAQLLRSPRLQLATPHIAGYSVDAKWKATVMLYQAMGEAGLVSKAQPAKAAAGAEPLHALGAETPIAALRLLMEQRYRIAEDDSRMRSIAALPAAQRGAAFDGLRRDYGERHELRGSALTVPQAHREVLPERVLRAFGIRVSEDMQ